MVFASRLGPGVGAAAGLGVGSAEDDDGCADGSSVGNPVGARVAFDPAHSPH